MTPQRKGRKTLPELHFGKIVTVEGDALVDVRTALEFRGVTWPFAAMVMQQQSDDSYGGPIFSLSEEVFVDLVRTRLDELSEVIGHDVRGTFVVNQDLQAGAAFAARHQLPYVDQPD